MAGAMSDVKSIFARALEIAAPAEREAYLAQTCGEDRRLRDEVESLLRADEAASGFLSNLSPPQGPTVEQPVTERPGEVIGPYKLLEQIGEGGFGVVFLAEQTEPVRRKVALKVLKPGMDTRQVVARFEAERQALAIMDHPNIARVYDGGATHTGRPYFVMELVRGVPITDYCDQNHLPPRQRLELFVQVCQAIQHAHQKGIIHRDLKPSNVLVSRHDSTPVVKVIDFGVAKALGQELTDKTLFTGVAQMVGTPLYMSPEQAGMSDLDVDTRSDVYSLGVLLYELLTGTTPFTRDRFKKAAYDEIRRIIREEEPPKPSTRLSESMYSLPSISAQRQTEPAKLTKLVRGELDWIVMKALEKDRNRRYETANGFAMDVQRYLADETVQACPPSVRYRLRKFLRRNRSASITAATLTIAVLISLSGIGWALRDRLARTADANRARDERRARITTQVDLHLADATRLENEQNWPEALAAAQRAESALAGGDPDPASAGQVRQALGDLTFVNLLDTVRMRRSEMLKGGKINFEGAVREYEAAFRDYGLEVEASPAGDLADKFRNRPSLAVAVAAGLDDWAVCRQEAGDKDGALALLKLASVIDPEPWRVRLREASRARDLVLLEQVAAAPETAGQPAVSQVLLSQLIQLKRPQLAVTVLERAAFVHPSDFWVHYNLGYIQHMLIQPARLHRAIHHCEVAVALRPRSSMALINLGTAYEDDERIDEATACYQRALELNPNNPMAQNNVGARLSEQKRWKQAIPHFRKAIELNATFPEFHVNLGRALAEEKEIDLAIESYETAIKIAPKYAPAHVFLGWALWSKGERQKALASCQKGVDLDPQYADARTNLGIMLYQDKQFDEAVKQFREEVRLAPKSARAKDRLVFGLQSLGGTLAQEKKFDEAIELLLEATSMAPKHRDARFNLAMVYLEKKQWEQAIEHFRVVVDNHPKFAPGHCYLALALQLQDKEELKEAIESYRRAIAIDPRFAMALNNLAELLATAVPLELRNPTEAVALARRAVEVDPASNEHWSTLAIASYRMGNWKAAEEALERKRKLTKSDDPLDLLLQAMIHRRLDRKEDARREYDKARAQWEKASEQDKELLRRRQEAELLLGIKEEAKK